MRKSLNPMSLTKKLSIQLSSRLAVYGFFLGKSYSGKRFKVTYSEPEPKVPSTPKRSALSAEKLSKATS